jgi:hypothetical protein
MEQQQASQELIAEGWQRVGCELLRARSAEHLIIHWFRTPTDADTHADAHWYDDSRIEKFVRIVIPTLAEQLDASMLTVAVPWGVDDDSATLALIAVVAGQPAVIDARTLTRSRLADAAPYWILGTEPVAAPTRLHEIVVNLTI